MQFVAVVAVMLLFNACSSNQSFNEEEATKIVFLSTADIHGHVFPWNYYDNTPDEQHSLLKVASLIDSVKAEHELVFTIDTGDWLQGNSFAEYFAREDIASVYPLLAVMEELEFDGIVLGNHEFNFGIPLLEHRMSQINTPFLGANVIRESDDTPFAKPYILLTANNISIGVIGLTTPGSAVWDRPRVEGILRFEDGIETARLYTEELYSKGADIVVIAAHSGFEGSSSYSGDGLGIEHFGRAIADEVPGIYALHLAHSHRVIENKIYYSDKNPHGVAVTQAGRWASHLGFTELFVHKDDSGQVSIKHGRNVALPAVAAPLHTSLEQRFTSQHEEVMAYMNQTLATTSELWDAKDARISDNPLTDLIQHVQMQVTGADLSSSAIFNTDTVFRDGMITRGSVASLYPYENTLFKIRISGADLKEYLEFSARYFKTHRGNPNEMPEASGVTPGYNFDVLYGASYEIDIREEPGNRIKNLRFKGEPVRDNDTFTLALNSYRKAGGGDFDMIARAETIEETDISIRLLIEEFLKEKGHINSNDVARNYWKLIY
ncbi:MAG: 5'-nucleotidase C-terminal domain-containing protein [Balneolales bacterium]|nr:5'-nucleotidase C-terminal domain-containing protein [Balneolales bacterium]